MLVAFAKELEVVGLRICQLTDRGFTTVPEAHFHVLVSNVNRHSQNRKKGLKDKTIACMTN